MYEPRDNYGPYLRPKAAAEYLNLAPSTLYAMVAQGMLPRPLKLSPGVSLFPRAELDAAVRKQAAQLKPTS